MTHRHLCDRCTARKARYQYRGAVRADRDHTLCFQCFRSERERQRARSFAVPDQPVPPHPPDARPPLFDGIPPASLTPAQRAHRFRMLQHLRSRHASSDGR